MNHQLRRLKRRFDPLIFFSSASLSSLRAFSFLISSFLNGVLSIKATRRKMDLWLTAISRFLVKIWLSLVILSSMSFLASPVKSLLDEMMALKILCASG